MTRRMLGLVSLVFALAASDQSLVRASPPERSPNLEDTHGYVVALIDSMSLAKSGLSRVDPNLDVSTLDGTAEMMVGIKLAAEDYKGAASAVADYQRSSNERIQMSAKAAHLAYTGIIGADRQTIAELVGLHDKGGPTQVGQLLDRMTDLRVLRNQSWKALPLAVGAAAQALVMMPTTPNEQISTLVITSDQREQLRTMLLESLGPGVKAPGKAGQTSLEFAGSTLYEFLSDKRWKTRALP